MPDLLSTQDLEPLRRATDCAVVAASTADHKSRVVALGTCESRTAFRIASLTKPFTAATVVLACLRTGTSLETPVVEVLPQLRRDWAASRSLTIAQTLAQTSGLASTVTASDVAALGDDDHSLLEAARLVVRAGSTRPPGEVWEYYNGNYFLAGSVAATLLSTTYEEALGELVLRPWGLSDTTFVPPSDLAVGIDGGSPVPPSAYPRGRRPSGGLCSTAPDLLHFGRRILDDPDLLAAIRDVRTRRDDPMRYGLGWAIGASGQMYLNGRLPGYRTVLMLLPDHGLVATGLAATSNALPTLARAVSDLQIPLTGDDLTDAIDGFAA
ncbi:serine hydrolase domain-containing protein [Nocardioides sp.]|uniref:serine hydrolase domain-containing protein n=1 Tax=Nocardioides sp. TaxID=35761 RepID=UPI002ED96760